MLNEWKNLQIVRSADGYLLISSTLFPVLTFCPVLYFYRLFTFYKHANFHHRFFTEMSTDNKFYRRLL